MKLQSACFGQVTQVLQDNKRTNDKMTDGYILHCKLKSGDAFEVPFEGFEDLSDVLAEIDAMAGELSAPWAVPHMGAYEAFGIVGVGCHAGEFCVASY